MEKFENWLFGLLEGKILLNELKLVAKTLVNIFVFATSRLSKHGIGLYSNHENETTLA